jgi:beta-galactosidase
VLLNGQPYQIRGLSRHQFLAGAGMSLTVAEDRKDIEDLKALGANFVRLAHYSQSQDVYDACDELGLLVWTEVPAWQSRKESLADEGVWENSAQPQLQAMVMQHRDHPSVVIWSVANEIPSENEIGAAYVARAIAYVKSLDKTRLVTFASDRRLGDKAFGSVDIIAVNEYFGWYYGKQDDVGPMLDQMHAKFPGKPILVSEFGQDGVAGWDAATAPDKSRDYSYAAESAFLSKHLAQIFARDKRGFVAGALVWVYNDFPDPHRVGGDHPVIANFRNNKGLVTMDRTRKPAYEVVKTFFHGLMAQPQ